jgi:hypothetical protein
MNPKHFHTPISTRVRCPVCHQPVYSRGGIHPQCAMRQSEPPIPKPEPPKVPVVAVEPEPVAISRVIAKVRPLKRPVAAVGSANPKLVR